MAILIPDTRRVMLVALAIAVVASPALAQDFSAIDAFFTTVGTALTGTTGRAMGLVALCGVGIMLLAGRMNWAFALSVCLGLAILFGAASILAGYGTA